LDEISLQEGAVAARVVVGFGGEENHLFSLSMYLYPLLNVVGCVWVFLSLSRFSYVFHLE
jgi:hypothetical protein